SWASSANVVLTRELRLKLAARSIQAAVASLQRGADDRRDLFHFAFGQLEQHEHFAVLGRQVVQCDGELVAQAARVQLRFGSCARRGRLDLRARLLAPAMGLASVVGRRAQADAVEPGGLAPVAELVVSA